VRFEIRAFCLKSLGNNILISVFKIMHVGRGVHGSVRFRLKKPTEPNYINFVKY
jgi:hypothetical protein